MIGVWLVIKSESNVIVFCLTILPLVHVIYKQLPRRAITSVSNVVILSFRYDAVFCVNKSVTFWYFFCDVGFDLNKFWYKKSRNWSKNIWSQNFGSRHTLELRMDIFIREGIRKKIRNYLGIFPKCQTPPLPPTPPFGNPSSKKKIYGLFCVLGPKEHF